MSEINIIELGRLAELKAAPCYQEWKGGYAEGLRRFSTRYGAPEVVYHYKSATNEAWYFVPVFYGGEVA